MRISKKLILAILMIFGMSAFLIGCTSTNKANEAFNTYKQKWTEKDFKGMYQILSSDSKSKITEEQFVSRYTNIYGAIGASNISITPGEAKKNDGKVDIPFTLTMNTVAGKVDLKDFKAVVVKGDDGYKVQWNDDLIFPKMVNGDKVKVETYKGTRGKILDRNGKVLAEDGKVSVIGIHPAVFNQKNKEAKIKDMAKTLDISEDTINKKLEANKNPGQFVEIVKIPSSDDKVKKFENREGDGILVQNTISRIYNGGEAFGRLVGYIGPITAEELGKMKDKGYTQGSYIGKSGLEQVYEDTLRKENGGEIYIERGNEKISVFKQDAKNGKDIKLSIDSKLQKKAYDEMNGQKGAATAVNPKNGEILAMVSAPSYDSNMFTTYITKTEKKNLEDTKYAAEQNRFSKAYSPGSTFKLITAATGLEDGKIKPDEGKDIKGTTWQKDSTWGDYKVTRVDDPGKPVNLLDAVKYSDNIYFAQVALDIGSENLINGAKKFGIGEKLDCGYPMENSQISNDGKIKDNIALADTGYGQGQVLVTPLNMALAYSALGNNGDIMKARLVTSIDGEAKVWKKSAIDKKYLDELVKVFEAPINGAGGTATDAKIPGISLAGKTGTAEIKSSQNDKNGKENGWFVAVDTKDSKIAISMILEDVKNQGGSHAVTPRVKRILESYLK
ncbi:penicillin-binding transpeptidase domain-containing protein [Eubacterium multiforme]|uniref:Penicillin-binding protein n=1 Tax=Eubacterium multiforme TaxID=83339 RepID=A0ABT9UQL8_9FIRM|nr:penicillin-binding transpeptidase domain-containing protein [Eubacterium multiforme]MDQ0148258.1 penicillin-binding protein [Eubacterium multiforme]